MKGDDLAGRLLGFAVSLLGVVGDLPTVDEILDCRRSEP